MAEGQAGLLTIWEATINASSVAFLSELSMYPASRSLESSFKRIPKITKFIVLLVPLLQRKL